ncbi:MAG: energy transducer TonB [Candidatus Kapaibacterium sp.]
MSITKYQRIISLFGLLAIILLGQSQQMSAQPSVNISIVSAETDADAEKVVLPSPEPAQNITYPTDALRERTEGLVCLKVLFDETGEILQTESIDSTVDRGLLYAAVNGLEKMRFNPGKINGANAKMWAVAEIDFRIEDDEIRFAAEEGSRTLQSADLTFAKVSEESNDFPDFIPQATPPSYDMNQLASYLQYPPEAEAKGIEGTVYIRAAIDKEGNLRQVKVIPRKGTDTEIFEEAALNAVRQTEFSPAIINGEPIEMSIIIPIRFKLEP